MPGPVTNCPGTIAVDVENIVASLVMPVDAEVGPVKLPLVVTVNDVPVPPVVTVTVGKLGFALLTIAPVASVTDPAVVIVVPEMDVTVKFVA